MRWSTSIALAIALASQAGCGIAERAGRGAAEGAIGKLARKLGDGDELGRLKGRAAGGIMGGQQSFDASSQLGIGAALALQDLGASRGVGRLDGE